MEGDTSVVASWVGLLSGIVGIVLSAVAILYAYVTNRRADAVNDATIRALAHIESDVDKLSGDVRSLIQDAWAKFVTTPGGASSEVSGSGSGAGTEDQADPSDEPVVDIGLTEELKAEIADAVGKQVTTEMQQQLDRTVDEFQQRTRDTVQGTRHGDTRRGRRYDPAQAFAYTLQSTRGLSTQAQELLRAVAQGRPLTRAEYSALERSPLASSLGELRKRSLVTPLSNARDGGNPGPSYGLPEARADAIRSAIRVLDPNPGAAAQIEQYLAAAGYGD